MQPAIRVGELGRRKHEAGGYDGSGQGGGGGTCSQTPDDQAKDGADAEGSPGDEGYLKRPPAAFEQDFRHCERENDEEHEFRLPCEGFLWLANQSESILRCGASPRVPTNAGQMRPRVKPPLAEGL